MVEQQNQHMTTGPVIEIDESVFDKPVPDGPVIGLNETALEILNPPKPEIKKEKPKKANRFSFLKFALKDICSK